jgi:hypothetical protein
MLSYNNDTKFKKQFVAEVVKHRKADMILQGSYGQQNGHWRVCRGLFTPVAGYP